MSKKEYDFERGLRHMSFCIGVMFGVFLMVMLNAWRGVS